jgi:hypothetical protein
MDEQVTALFHFVVCEGSQESAVLVEKRGAMGLIAIEGLS